VSATPAAYAALLERAAELADLRGIGALLWWDQSTKMPDAGARSRAQQVETLERITHHKATDPEIGRLLDELEPWAGSLDPDSIEARALNAVRRDFEKAVRVPDDLAAEMAGAAALGEQAWMRARAAGEFRLFRDALARQVELRHRYTILFPEAEHPYDVLLDDYEPEATLAEIRPLFTELREGLLPLVAQARGDGDGPAEALPGAIPAASQEAFMVELLRAHGYDPRAWRLDATVHPFAMSIGVGDTRLTTAYLATGLDMAFWSCLHEYGHGLYESGIDTALRRHPLGSTVSLGVHESQSRMWENAIGRSRPFCEWVTPRLATAFPDYFDDLAPDRLFRDATRVRPSLIRIHADETTYNLHIVLRLDLEVRLFGGDLRVDELPEAWDAGMHELLGVEVPDVSHGVLQDVHWGAGLMGYFPTYALGNLMSAQFWATLRRELGDVDGMLAQGDTAELREWLRERIHRHGRTFPARELLRRVTGEELQVQPFLRYLRQKLADAGHLGAGAA